MELAALPDHREGRARALAAGCTIVLKPSELSPLSALLFAQVLHDAGLPPGVFNLVNGTGPEVGKAMAAHPGIDLISITGSTRAGVARRAGSGTDGQAHHSGVGRQISQHPVARCGFRAGGRAGRHRRISQRRPIVQRAHPDARAAGPSHRRRATRRGDRRRVVRGRRSDIRKTVLGPVANRAQFNRVQEMIDAGITPTAPSSSAAVPDDRRHRPRGFYVRPTIFSEVHTGMRIAQEEIFGPVLLHHALSDGG